MLLITEDELRAAIGPLFLLATSGQVPTTWDDKTRADAQLVLDAFEDALIEAGENVAALRASGPVERAS